MVRSTPLYHWDTELQTLVPVPPNATRVRQPAITETTFKLIHRLARQYDSIQKIHEATSWSSSTIEEVLRCATYAQFQRRRIEHAERHAALRKTQKSQLDTEQTTDLEATATELATPMQEETQPLADFVIDRIVKALEGIDDSLRGIREDTRENLELTRKLYDLWKPEND